MAKWIVRIPYEGVGYIPLETDEDPKSSGFKQLVNNRVQIGNVHVNKPSFFKQERIQVDPADDDEYAKLRRSIDEVNKREGVHVTRLSSVLDAVADSLEAKGLMKQAADIDVISNTVEAAANQLFDSYGNFHGKIPKEAVRDCSGPGPADEAVAHWRKKLNFEVPRQKAIQYLKEYGAWTLEELNGLDDTDLAEKVLWLACGDIKENGEWFGLVH
jgi:hypothetical protein